MIKNRIISKARAVYYFIYEPAATRLARRKFKRRKTPDSDHPLISVYCPTYNRKEILLERAVKSVLSQTYKNFEFIIVGDHCTDGTGEFLKRNVDDPRVRFFNLPLRKKRYPPTRDNHWFAGPVVASNHGLKLCRGEWIARIDDDDIWTLDHLEKLLNLALEGNYEFVSSDYVENRNGRTCIVRAPMGYIGGTSSWLYRSYLRFFKYNIDCWRKTDKRVNDLDLADRTIKAGVRHGYLKKVTYNILPRPGEETIGADVYRNSDSILETYKFKD